MCLRNGIINAHIKKANRICIKVGSSLLIDKNTGSLNEKWFKSFISDIASLKSMGKEIIIISSGSIALGRKVLNIDPVENPNDKTESSACASVGQIELAHAYQESLYKFKIPVGLVLITTRNTEVRDLYLNLRDTIDKLLNVGAIPVVNENDAVSDRNDCYGDNDRLSARIAGMSGSDLLILFSDVDGLYTDNPINNKNAKLIPIIDNIDDNILQMASGKGSNLSSGGMETKLLAAIIARSAGCDMIIANGTFENPLSKLNNSKKYSFFSAGEHATTARKHWIIGSPEPAGTVTVDKGAVKALLDGNSLLSVGIKSVDGDFSRGDCISILDGNGIEIARGLAGYDKKEIFMILGRQTKDIISLLGYIRKEEVVHRNDMVMV